MLFNSGMRAGYSTPVHPNTGEVGTPVPNPSSPPPTAGTWRVRKNDKLRQQGVKSARPSAGSGMPRTQQGIASPNTQRARNARQRRIDKEMRATPQGTHTDSTPRHMRALPGSIF